MLGRVSPSRVNQTNTVLSSIGGKIAAIPDSFIPPGLLIGEDPDPLVSESTKNGFHSSFSKDDIPPSGCCPVLVEDDPTLPEVAEALNIVLDCSSPAKQWSYSRNRRILKQVHQYKDVGGSLLDLSPAFNRAAVKS